MEQSLRPGRRALTAMLAAMLAAALLLAASLLLAACGGDGGGGRDAAPAPAVTSAAPPAGGESANPYPTAAPRETADLAPAESMTAAAATPDSAVAAATGGVAAAAAAGGAPEPITIILDPGHGIAADAGAEGNGVIEHESNLEMAFRVERLLSERGYRVVMTRRAAGPAAGPADTAPAGSFGAGRQDRQRRIDLANAEGGDLFLSLHSNAHTLPTLTGVEAWWDPDRPFSADNLRLAQVLTDSVTSALAAAGHPVYNRGPQNGACWRNFNGICRPLFVIGPPRVIERAELERRGLDPANFGFAPDQLTLTTRATEMPGAILELLFVSNPDDAVLLRDDAAREAMARGVADAVDAFFAPAGDEAAE